MRMLALVIGTTGMLLAAEGEPQPLAQPVVPDAEIDRAWRGQKFDVPPDDAQRHFALLVGAGLGYPQGPTASVGVLAGVETESLFITNHMCGVFVVDRVGLGGNAMGIGYANLEMLGSFIPVRGFDAGCWWYHSWLDTQGIAEEQDFIGAEVGLHYLVSARLGAYANLRDEAPDEWMVLLSLGAGF